eukprot:scaffold198814_cov66-Cyclotella_meneghiniana.AAC.1
MRAASLFQTGSVQLHLIRHINLLLKGSQNARRDRVGMDSTQYTQNQTPSVTHEQHSTRRLKTPLTVQLLDQQEQE